MADLQVEALAKEVQELRLSLAVARQELAQELQEKQLLQDITRSIDLPRLLKVLGEQVIETLDADGYLLNFVDEGRKNLVCEALRLPSQFRSVEETYLHFKFPMKLRDANVAALKKRQAIFLDADGVEKYPGTTKNRFERWQMREMVVLPIVERGHAIGTVMAFRTGAGIDPARAEVLQRRLALFGKQLRNALYYKNLRDKEREIRAAAAAHKEFLRFVERINNLTSINSIYDLITEEFLRRLPFNLVAVLTKEKDRLEIRKLAVSDGRFHELRAALTRLFERNGYTLVQEDGATPTVYLQNSHLYFPDALEIIDLPMSERDRASLKTMGTPRTIFIVPIRYKGSPNGVLWLVSLEQPVPLSEPEKEFVELLCSFVGTAIANAELYSVVGRQHQEIEQLNAHLQEKVEELRRLASRDGLTGLANFGAFEQELLRRMNEYQRDSKNHKLSLVIADVDHFKRFNDTYGHLAGNLVLQEVAKRLREVARKMDIPCRYGGEEFVVILPKCGPEGARIFAERLRARMAEEPFQVDDMVLPVTVSVGCATYLKEETMSDLIERADKALYLAKQAGRNRVMVAEVPV